MDWRAKLYEISSVIEDIIEEAQRGKISWKEACLAAKAEANFSEEEIED